MANPKEKKQVAIYGFHLKLSLGISAPHLYLNKADLFKRM